MTAARQEIAALRRLATHYGVQTRFTDAEKQRVDAPPESLLAALRGLGAPVDRIADAAPALREHLEETWRWSLEPVQLAWDGWLDGVRVRVPGDEVPDGAEIEVTLEDGEPRSYHSEPSVASVSSKMNLDGQDYVTLELPLHERLPNGYHELTLRLGGRGLRSLVIAAPQKAYADPRGNAWGCFLPLYAVHSKRSWGIGDLTDLGTLVEWSAGLGAGFIGTLPLLASFLDGEPFEPSPYLPVSRLFWNEIYIDVDAAVTALSGCGNEDGDVPAATAKAARDLNAREAVPYREVMALKRRVLTEFTRHTKQDPTANEVTTGPRGPRPAHHEYAAFRAALETLGPRWREWPSPQRSGSLGEADFAAETARYYATAQGIAEAQMARLQDLSRQRGVRLYLDLPVGVHPDGFDSWRYQHLFVEGMKVGAPPDKLAPRGQNWGFQPLNPLTLRRRGYEYVRQYFSVQMRAAGLLRIDHAIGLHRLFWIPEGGEGRDGVFVRQPAEELYAILSLESHRAESILMGENLGLVPAEVDRGLARHGVGGMYVQSFAMTGDPDKPLRPPRRNSIASFGTHDLAPFAAFWTDQDLVQRAEAGIMPPRVAKQLARERAKGRQALAAHLKHRRLIADGATAAEAFRGSTRLLAESEARWAMLNLEDAWSEPRPQNVPGTDEAQHANWTRRARYGLEEFGQVDDITKAAAIMRDTRGGGREVRRASRP